VTFEQGLVFGLFGAVFALLLWGRWRYDLVAFTALLVAAAAGLVPGDAVFSGFGHPATVIVGLVLVVSAGLANAGVVDLVARKLLDAERPIPGHVAAMGGIGAVLSAFMNNVAALALLMPVDMRTAKRAGRSAGVTLMPLAFATILGGLATLIGTPPNIIVASVREESLGAPFAMFDFAPVGATCAAAGLVFVALIGWRLIPKVRTETDPSAKLTDLEPYIAELVVPEDFKHAGETCESLRDAADEADVTLLGIVRGDRRVLGPLGTVALAPGDLLVVQAEPDALDSFRAATGLAYPEAADDDAADGRAELTAGGTRLLEAVVPADAPVVGRSADGLALDRRFAVTLLGVSRRGEPIRQQVRRLPLEAGDVLLLLGPEDSVPHTAAQLGLLALAERGVDVRQEKRAWLAAGAFALAVVAASLGALSLPVALGAVAVVYVAGGILPLSRLYDAVEWPVVVLLGSMIPLGTALEATGGTTLLADGLTQLIAAWPAWAILAALMAVTMTLSDLLNNTATTIVAAPMAIDVATRLDANPDTFLMAVAVAASCAFLTPIGHKNNTLILGPGGYAFGDYWRMGLPLELLIIAVGVPMILVVWPL